MPMATRWKLTIEHDTSLRFFPPDPIYIIGMIKGWTTRC
jgi:hypothetical protein